VTIIVAGTRALYDFTGMSALVQLSADLVEMMARMNVPDGSGIKNKP
jgi:hypothetical protein